MRLLSTDRAELHFFASPEDVPGGYAILSHVWDAHEDTFQDIEAFRVQCSQSGANPRDFVSNKIRQSCILAEKHGYKWIWVDTCCIDKSSSAELSEAINSMYRYYALSTICYAFLRDVETRDRMKFSTWYKRGWTLQELLAPKLLIFVSSRWEVLGTKGDIVSEITSCTGIPEDVLRHERDLTYVPVGQRMSWACFRVTTRVEDRAYSLMGIFGIHMPTMYGEGHNAFYRLQEEIMKVSVDPSLFAWGVFQDADHASDFYDSSSVLFEDPEDHKDMLRDSSLACKHSLQKERALLAPSPDLFRVLRERLVDIWTTDETLQMLSLIMEFDIPSLEMTPHGVLAYLPVARHRTTPYAFIALLSCIGDGGSWMVGLQLFQCFYAGRGRQKIPVLHVGEENGARLTEISDLGKINLPFWKKFYISSKPRFQSALEAIPKSLTRIQLVSSSPFRISRGTVVHGFEDFSVARHIVINQMSNIPIGWKGYPPLAVQFLCKDVHGGGICFCFILTLGCCQSRTLSPNPSLYWGPQWATFRTESSLYPSFTNSPKDDHQCDRDHIVNWPRTEDGGWVRLYKTDWNSARLLMISFSTCPLNVGGTTLALKVEVVEAKNYPWNMRG